MANYGLTNNLSALPLHSTSQYDSELIVVDNNAGRPITARASYITNLNDLVISLSADHVAIGDFNIADPDTGLNANVVPVGVGQGALRVLTQDLDSVHDSISLGDISGNYVSVTNSALNVFTTNGISAVSVTNFPTQLTAVSVTNQLTGLNVLNPVTAVQVLNPISAFSLTNQITSISVTNFPTQLTAVSVPIIPPTLFQFNNFNINNNRGWTMSNSQIPMLAVRVKPNAGVTAKVLDYEIGNNNNASSTIGYVWYESPTLSGSYSWVDLNSSLQYAIFTDAYGSNTPNGISGGTTRHSGIIIGKNASSEAEIEDIALTGGGSPNVLALAVQRLDSSTKLDVWFAVTLGI